MEIGILHKTNFPDLNKLDTLSEVYGLCTQVTNKLRWGHRNGIKEMISKVYMWKMSSEPGLEGQLSKWCKEEQIMTQIQIFWLAWFVWLATFPSSLNQRIQIRPLLSIFDSSISCISAPFYVWNQGYAGVCTCHYLSVWSMIYTVFPELGI